MDREKRFDRIKKAYDLYVHGKGEVANNIIAKLNECYENGVYDEFIEPIVIEKEGVIKDNDAVIFFNYRTDRSREITDAITQSSFKEFETKKIKNLYYCCMTEYSEDFKGLKIAFEPEIIKDNLSKVIADAGLKQYHITETTKYAHVTFFFNGGVEEPYDGEDRCVIPSPKVATYDLQPEMSAYLVAEECVKRIESDKYDVIILNFANCDMVGHTGDFGAAVKAVEAVDECVGKVVDAIMKKGGAALITADHGKADRMLVEAGSDDPFTAHTTNPVPLIAIGTDAKELKTGGVLADLIPTMLDVMNMEKPDDMTGNSLLVK